MDYQARIPAALAAIHANSEDAWAHAALAGAYMHRRRFDDCLAEFELALRLNPSFASARGYYGVALAYCGRWEEGDRAARHALRLSPRDPFAAVYYGVASYCQFVGGNYEEAINLSRESLRLRSDFVGGHRVLTAAAAMTKQRELATASLKALLRVQPDLSIKWLAGEMPFKGDAERDQYLAAFRWAGLK